MCFLFLSMAEGNRQILESMSCSHLAIEEMEVLFLFLFSFLFFHFFFIEHIIIHLRCVNWPRVLFKPFPIDISHTYDYIVWCIMMTLFGAFSPLACDDFCMWWLFQIKYGVVPHGYWILLKYPSCDIPQILLVNFFSPLCSILSSLLVNFFSCLLCSIHSSLLLFINFKKLAELSMHLVSLV